MKAIRIDKDETIFAKRHIDALLTYQNREKLTDDEIDAMLEAGKIEFGQVFLKGKEMTQEFSDDKQRTSLYKRLDIIWSCVINW